MSKEKSIFKRKILSTLLHYANQYTFFDKGDIFYEIKTSILAHNAIQIGKQVQHIVKKCYSCDGTGIFSEYYDGMTYRKVTPEPCYKCKKGVYDEFYSLLVLWKFGNYEFHTFVDRIEGPLFHESYFKNLPLLEPIEGKVKKKKIKNWLHREALLWLIFIYKREHFMSRLKKSCPAGRVYTPMCILNKIVFRHRHYRNYAKAKTKANFMLLTQVFNTKNKLVLEDYSELPF